MSLVKEKFQDSTGDWIVRAFISDNETHFFTFTGDPTEQDVETVRANFLAMREFIYEEQGVLVWQL